MKIFGIIVKIVTALTVIAGAVYLAATYGDKIVAWAKKLLASCKCCECECDCDCECECEGDCECGCECNCECEAEEVAEEVIEAADETEVVAAEADFEG